MSDPFRAQLKEAIERIGVRKVADLLGIGEISVLRLAAGADVRSATRQLAVIRASRLTELHAP